MLLSNKIMNLRRELNWSQEELAEKLDISRQSVSKWESGNSTPDIDKIIKLAEIFNVTTDYLLVDESRKINSSIKKAENREYKNIRKVSMQEVDIYLDSKIELGKKVALGVLIIMLSTIPLFILLGLSEANMIAESLGEIVGFIILLIGVATGVSILLKSESLKRNINVFEESEFELGYGVKENLDFGASNKLNLSISMFIISALPVLISGFLDINDSITLYSLCITIFISAIAVYIVIPEAGKREAVQRLLSEGDFAPNRRKENIRNEKLAGVYWPIVVAIYLGWSFWSGKWGITWIVWPVAGVGFAALVGLARFFDKE